MKNAIEAVFTTNEFYISPDLNSLINPKKAVEITDFDIFLIKYLSLGFLQDTISKKLKAEGITPSSRSAIEKRLKILKEHFNAKNPTNLVAIAKDFGLI